MQLISLIVDIYEEHYEEHNVISKCQIGFQKHKRTSDHIFVLKCIIEEAKVNKKPIYGCFIDLKKAFDTVWIKGLLYKLLFNCNISPKLVRIIGNMYTNLGAHVNSNGQLGSLFKITVGTRQGCNQSPTLFNLFINDLPLIIGKGDCDPVSLNNMKINILMYADDTLILSKSRKGLQKALHILQVYCHKWQLKINIDKTKVMIFNKLKVEEFEFELNGEKLQIVHKYNYLGLKISSNGSFTAAIKELGEKARRAYHVMRGPLIDSSIQPRVYMKLFESLVKPIALYGCEVWGGFGHKSASQENILSSVLKNDKPTYEQLHLKVCKQILHTSKRASNLGVRSDLGRLPLMFNIICAVCKYRIRW